MLEMVGDKMEEIANNVHWPYLAGTSSPTDSGGETPVSMTRPDKARDIMSAFSETTMPDEFRTDLVETINQPRTPEQCVVQGDFEATMFRLAVHDESVYASLRRVMPPGARAAIFFDKMRGRTRALLAEFDLYRQTGALRCDGTAPEAPFIAGELHKYLEQIQDNIYARSPHGTKGAAEVLVYLLQDVAGRNYDAFEGSDWGRRALPNERDHDRNLYLQLIPQSAGAESFFVLDCLETLPEQVLRPWVLQLNAIFGKLRVNAAAVPYLQKLQMLMSEERPSAGASGQKRPATGSSGSGRKRTR